MMEWDQYLSRNGKIETAWDFSVIVKPYLLKWQWSLWAIKKEVLNELTLQNRIQNKYP